jgi:predicted alpha/beta superfamily hydrolase
MKRILAGIGLMLATPLIAQDAAPGLELKPKAPITVGQAFLLPSRILGEDRTIQVALPDGYSTGDRRYPAMYIVDGQWNFVNTRQAMQSLAITGRMPEMILVSIHTDAFRDRDLLPTRDEKQGLGGGADQLHRFIKEELIPVIEKQYRANGYRLLSGTSFGGVFVMHAFLKDPALFSGYLSLSPSMWWDDRLLIKRTQEFLKKSPGLENALYLSLADEGSGMGVEALAKVLRSEAPSGLKWKFEQFPQEVHESIAYRSIYDGLRFVFSGWKKDPVAFETRGDLVASGDTVKVELKGASKQICYSLDGTEPTLLSPVYDKPLEISKPTVIKAIPVFGNRLAGNTGSLAINVLRPHIAETQLPALKVGLKFAYFEGDWDKLPEFARLAPVKSGVAANLEMQERRRPDSFAFQFSGFLEIPEDGLYQFHLSSDDGSRLLLGDQVIVDNDGLHGDEERSGKAFLKAGKHRLMLQYFQKGGGVALKLAYSGPRMDRRELPFTALSCPVE